MNLNQLTLSAAIEGLKKRKFSSFELVNDCFETISQNDKKLNAFLTLNKKAAINKALHADKKGGAKGKIEGIPMAIKDVFVTKGIRTTAGSKILSDFIPPYSATVVEKLETNGGIIIGKTNCDPFAFGASGENSGFGPTLNPLDYTRVPGGSSSGSAAAVAAHEAIFSLGSDTGGSVRQPASFCGLVGLKPTYGRCSRYGLIAMASSFDCPGPIGKTAEDTAIVLELMSGEDSLDNTSSAVKVEAYSKILQENKKTKPLAGLAIGVPDKFFREGLQKEVGEALEKTIRNLKTLGAKVKHVELPYAPLGIAVYYVLVPSEISSNMGRYDGIRFGKKSTKGETALMQSSYSRSEYLEDEVKRRIMTGTHTLSVGYYDAFYLKASKVRTLIIEDFKRVFKDVDAIVTPVYPTTAFKLGEKVNDPVEMYLADIFTVPASVSGIPAISVPCGLDKKNMPIGFQVMANYFREDLLLKIAQAYERGFYSPNKHD